MKFILTGYMGSGKSVVGKTLAEEKGLPFFDLDEQIAVAEGKSIPEIFQSSGEIYFRKKESEVLEALMNSEDDFVLALGGGTPCYANNLKRLLENPRTHLIYLKASLKELVARLEKEKSERPLISHLESAELLEDFVRKHLFERTYYYNQSEVIIDTDGKDIETIVQEINARLD